MKLNPLSPMKPRVTPEQIEEMSHQLDLIRGAIRNRRDEWSYRLRSRIRDFQHIIRHDLYSSAKAGIWGGFDYEELKTLRSFLRRHNEKTLGYL